MRGLNDWEEYAYRLTDILSIIISIYSFNKISFNKKANSIRTTFFRDNNLNKKEFFDKLFNKLEILDETLILQEITFNKIKNSRIIPKKLKLIVFKRDKGKCVICKIKGKGGLMWKIHYDHDFPFSRNGSSLTPQNIQLLCLRCNLEKSDKIE